MYSSDRAFSYHERTKHHPRQYARSPGYLDWANQPNPFRRFAGSRLIHLPFSVETEEPCIEAMFCPLIQAPRPVNRKNIGALLEHSLALSAWKEYQGSRWELRCNPSSGNLHPTEGYLVTGPVEGLTSTGGVYHYVPDEHGLEERAVLAPGVWRELAAALPEDAFLLGFSTIFWREAWKYGERAYRYANHDIGHALAAVALAASTLGWRTLSLGALPGEAISETLGLGETGAVQEEREYPEILLVIAPAKCRDGGEWNLAEEALVLPRDLEWLGEANRLSTEHVAWEVIGEVAQACAKPATAVHLPAPLAPASSGPAGQADEGISAWRVMLQRRSAVAMDGETSISRDAFYRMLSCTLPVQGRAPWDALGSDPCIHLAIFVHRVDGLVPGIYFLIRDGRDEAALRTSMRSAFKWELPPGCPEGLPLHFLSRGDVRELAAQACCQQEIAGDGAFSLGMIARFEKTIVDAGAWMYPRLFWEAGAIGQVLYLEAEAAGVRGTGIGCYFDDLVHQILGLEGRKFQSLYHFTVGGAVEDPRLRSLPPYSAERRALIP